MSKYLASILTVLGAVAVVLAPAIQGAIAAHPVFAAVFAAIVGVLNHFLPSPTAAVQK